ncbi:hypothetical protein QBC38DRAFT_234997 [Podospora fimiseda]|uniref:rRNA biogenesis protein RRP36 n=1 Tax=Podospora fimiseda TaxID=252190 RepID=A0AAN7BMQ2_9PEZI|nr:hypothetical protein QBC38DRAFT_234997 [Podospora fimiseda]
MSSTKRKMPAANLLQRRVRPRYEPEPESDIEEDDMSEAPSEEGAGFEDEEEELSEDDEMANDSGEENESQAGSDVEDEDDGEEEEEDDDDDAPKIDATQLSFGALARAQASLGNVTNSKRKRRISHGSAVSDTSSKSQQHQQQHVPLDPREKEREELRAAQKRFKEQKQSRSSKHAPTEISSKRQVSRKRDFLSEGTLHKSHARDPRFMPLPSKAGSDSRIEEIKFRKAYAFLDEYRESEMAELRATIKKTRDLKEKEKLQKALLSMESRKKAQERKDKERKVIEEHRQKEKELVKQGKTPFYLKKQELKKKVLEETFKGMKKGQVDKAIERRRKKVAGKEKKNLPFARRSVGDR